MAKDTPILPAPAGKKQVVVVVEETSGCSALITWGLAATPFAGSPVMETGRNGLVQLH